MDLIKRIQELESSINEKFVKNNIIIRILGSTEKNKGQIIILKDKKINRGFEINVISYSQIDIIENGKVLERGLFIDNLGKWLFNLYNPIEYLYVFYGGNLNRKILTREQVNKISKETTQNFEEERKNGLLVHRKELDDQPIVENYLGPMFEEIDYGKIYLRYETQEVYDMLSR